MTTASQNPENGNNTLRAATEIVVDVNDYSAKFDALLRQAEEMKRRPPTIDKLEAVRKALQVLGTQVVVLRKELRATKQKVTGEDKQKLADVEDLLWADPDEASNFEPDKLPLNLRIEALLQEVEMISTIEAPATNPGDALNRVQESLAELAAKVEENNQVNPADIQDLIAQVSTLTELMRAAGSQPSTSALPLTPSTEESISPPAVKIEEDDDRMELAETKRKFFGLGEFKDRVVERLFGTKTERMQKSLTKELVKRLSKISESTTKLSYEIIETALEDLPINPNKFEAAALAPILLYAAELGYITLSPERLVKVNKKGKLWLEALKEQLNLRTEEGKDETDQLHAEDRKKVHNKLKIWMRLNKHRLQAIRLEGVTAVSSTDSEPSSGATTSSGPGIVETLTLVEPESPVLSEAPTPVNSTEPWEVLGKGSEKEQRIRKEMFLTMKREFDLMKGEDLSQERADHMRMLQIANQLLANIDNFTLPQLNGKRTVFDANISGIIRALAVENNRGKLQGKLKAIVDKLSA